MKNLKLSTYDLAMYEYIKEYGEESLNMNEVSGYARELTSRHE